MNPIPANVTHHMLCTNWSSPWQVYVLIRFTNPNQIWRTIYVQAMNSFARPWSCKPVASPLNNQHLKLVAKAVGQTISSLRDEDTGKNTIEEGKLLKCTSAGTCCITLVVGQRKLNTLCAQGKWSVLHIEIAHTCRLHDVVQIGITFLFCSPKKELHHGK